MALPRQQQPQLHSANPMIKYLHSHGSSMLSNNASQQFNNGGMMINNKENEQPNNNYHSINANNSNGFGGPNSGLSIENYESTQQSSNQQQQLPHFQQSFHPPASAKAQFGQTIHAPRQSFAKRSFGRDLMNLQSAQNSGEHKGFNNHLQGGGKASLKTRSYLNNGGQSTLQTQASTVHQVSATTNSHLPPQIMHSNNGGSSIVKLKTFGEHKNSSVGVNPQDQPRTGPHLPNMMSSLSINLQNQQQSQSIGLSRHTQRPPASQDRKGISCLSQDRAISSAATAHIPSLKGSSANQMNKLGLTQFGAHGTNFSQIMVPQQQQLQAIGIPALSNQAVHNSVLNSHQHFQQQHHQMHQQQLFNTQQQQPQLQNRAQSAFNQHLNQTASQFSSIVHSAKEKQCPFCKEWKQPALLDQHLRSCTYNYNKENEEMKPVSSEGSKQGSLMTTLSNFQDAKQKRLKQFKQQLKEQQEREIDPIDQTDLEDPQTCAEYSKGIFSMLRAMDNEPGNNNSVSSQYMQSQEDINEKMRAILIDWLIEVHLKFKLVPESLYLTVNLIDRYLEKEQVNRQKLQLVGVTSMLIACKYEEIYPPIVKDFVYITDNAYTKEEILDMERRMLQVLDFNIQITSSFRFLERYVKIAKADPLIFNLSRYLIELSLLNCKMLRFSNSNIAASALYLSQKMTRNPQPWPANLVEHTQYTEQQVRPCAKDLFLLLQEAQTSTLEAVKKKFALPKFNEVSRIRLEHSTGTPSTASTSQNSSQIQQSAGSAQRNGLQTAGPSCRTSNQQQQPQRMSTAQMQQPPNQMIAHGSVITNMAMVYPQNGSLVSSSHHFEALQNSSHGNMYNTNQQMYNQHHHHSTSSGTTTVAEDANMNHSSSQSQ